MLILRRAQKELSDLPKAEYERIRDAVAALAGNPRPAGCKKLVGREGGAFVQEITEPSTK